MSSDQPQTGEPRTPKPSGLDDLRTGELERILADLLVAKYPGIEQGDIERMFRALDTGDPDRVAQVEADVAEKSARWMQAAVDLEA